MPYNTSKGGSASSALEQGGGDSGGQDPSQKDDASFYIPDSFPGADDLKSGDTITLKVVGRDADGSIQVQSVSDEEEEAGEQGGGMMDNFDKEVGS